MLQMPNHQKDLATAPVINPQAPCFETIRLATAGMDIDVSVDGAKLENVCILIFPQTFPGDDFSAAPGAANLSNDGFRYRILSANKILVFTTSNGVVSHPASAPLNPPRTL
jgi:hypothetical protein